MRRGSGLELAGIVERDATRHESLRDQFAVPCTTGIESLLGMVAAQCALVCTPDHLHASDALLCLRAGLHVLVEKPLCPSFGEAEQLAASFLRGSRVLAGGLVERHNPAWRVFQEHAPSLGGLRTLEILRSGRTPSHRESGVLRDLAIHDLDLLWGWLGPLSLDRSPDGDPASLVLRGSSRPGIELAARWDDGPPRRTWRLRGEGGTLDLDLLGRTVTLSRSDRTTEALPVPVVDPLEQEQRQFAAVLRGESDPAELGLARQLDVLAFCDALDAVAYGRSGREGLSPRRPPGSPRPSGRAACAWAPVRPCPARPRPS